ncbi:MAG: DUF4405 domain-containing protein [Verrucomicrobia bacterium]|nr:MAG: DUF4405 domain-containing protein [Verrucomicrobiota bacterium]
MNTEEKGSKHWRPLLQGRVVVSVFILAAFAVLTVSGAVLFLAPPGRIANWTDWRIWGYTKAQWQAVHIVFAAAFVVAAVVHLCLNWRPLVSYLRSRVTRRFGVRAEWVVALLLAVGVWAGTHYQIPPFSSLVAWGAALRHGWEEPARRAPVPHAELMSVAELARASGVDVAEALRRLEAAGIPVPDAETPVRDVANRAGVSPERIHRILSGERGGRGGGYGRRSGGGYR